MKLNKVIDFIVHIVQKWQWIVYRRPGELMDLNMVPNVGIGQNPFLYVEITIHVLNYGVQI